MALSSAGWTAIYQAQVSRYQALFDSDHNMDSKGGVVLSATLAVAVFVLDKKLFTTDDKFIFALVVVGCLVFITVIGLLLFALKPRNYSSPANTTKDHPEYLLLNDEDMIDQLVVDVEYASDEIEKNLRKKAAIFSIATLLFLIGTASLLTAKLIQG